MIIELLDGKRYDIKEYGLKRLYHRIPSLNIANNTQFVDGRGDLILSSTLSSRNIQVDLLFEVTDIFDFYLLRDQLNDIFVREEEFYLIFKNEPYHRFKVKLASGFLIEPHHIIGSFSIEFVMTNRYIESTYTTMDEKEWDINKFAWNGQISWDDDYKYEFNTNEFSVYNLGNAIIDPRISYLTIRLKGNFPNRLRITNLTTNDIYELNSSLDSASTLVIENVKSSINGVSVFSLTNKKLITLNPGENRFLIEGGSDVNISFDFRFLTK